MPMFPTPASPAPAARRISRRTAPPTTTFSLCDMSASFLRHARLYGVQGELRPRAQNGSAEGNVEEPRATRAPAFPGRCTCCDVLRAAGVGAAVAAGVARPGADHPAAAFGALDR